MPAWKMLEGVKNDRVHMSQIAIQSPATLSGPTLTYFRDVQKQSVQRTSIGQPRLPQTHTRIQLCDDVYMIGTPFGGVWQAGMTKHVHVFTSEAPETQHLGSVEPSSSWDHWICSHQSIFRLGNPTVCTGVYFEQYFNCRIMSNFSRFSPSLTEIIYRLVWCIPWSFLILSSELGWVKGARKLGEGKSIQ